MSAYSVEGLRVEVIEGDITEADTEAIANAANSNLRMGAGVAGAIKRRGGSQIEQEAVKRGPVEVGSAVETGAGDLPHRYVIHGAVMGQDLQTNADLIARTTRSALALADDLGLSSLALPAFGTGVGGVGVAECAAAMVGAIDEFAASAESLERVALVLFGEDTHREFDSVADSAWGN